MRTNRQYDRMVKRKKMARTRQLIMRLSAGIVLAVISAVVVVSLAANSEKALASEEKSKVFHTYVVQQNDTLWKLYEGSGYDSRNDYISEVIQINHLSDEGRINEGMYIILPELK